jgi:stage II sporulation protein D
MEVSKGNLRSGVIASPTKQSPKKSLLILTLVGLFFLWGQVSTQNLDEARYQQASDQIRDGQYLEAAESYKMILESSNDKELKAKVQELLGDLYALYLEIPDQAKAAYEKVLKDYSNSPWVDDAIFNIGMIYFEKGKWDEARERFQEVLRKYPDSPRAFTAQTLFEQSEAYLTGASKAPPPVQAPAPSQVASQTIRVLIIDAINQATISASTPITVSGGSSRGGTNAGTAVQVVMSSGLFSVNGSPMGGGDITLSCSDQSLSVSDRTFRGDLICIVKNSGFIIVNRVSLEDYLRGVVPKEMPSSWNVEALKAQTVAARTFALYQIEKHQDEQWDVMATVMSQVYGGRSAETANSDRAVRETTGQILIYNQRPVLAYFHSNSGGNTDPTQEVFGTELPYLEGVKDPYSTGTKADTWEATFSQDQINSALASDGITGVTNLSPAQTSSCGRVSRIRFQTSSGVKELSANTTRLRLGSTVMKSTWWQVSNQGGQWHFQGRGYGHGVGMSQWGAKAMADQGNGYLKILKHYYPKCSVSGV